MTPQEIYNTKKVTIDEALSHIRSGDCLAGGTYASEPVALYRRLHTIAGRVSDVRVWTANEMEDYPFLTEARYQPHFLCHSAFYGPTERAIHGAGRVSYSPWYLSQCGPNLVRADRPRVYMAAVAPMDEEGYFRLSSCLQWEYEAYDASEVHIFEVNPHVPRLKNSPRIHVSQITCLVESDLPVTHAPEVAVTEVERQIGAYAAELIRDGDTLQIGIGGTSNAVAEALCGKHDLGVHTELFSSPMGRLMEQGVINNSRKTLHPGKAVCALTWGSEDFYRFLHDNPDVELRPAAYVNDPFVIAQNDNMVSINTALQLDLTGQICSESLGPRQYSGTGGSTDFAMGVSRSRGGRGIIAVTSTARGGTVSRIQPTLSLGAVVSIQRNLVDYVVTEYGVAHLRHASLRQRAQRLIAIAHPDFRAELTRQAHDLLLW
jgi:acyl-CoA hydrolase